MKTPSLSPQSAEIVAATAGVVAEHAVEITRSFYPNMFAAHPELLRVFNKANQAIGEQPVALASSVVAYAVHLIDPDAPDFTPVMERIAHKHVSLGIKATEYTIVGHYLLEAVGQVLGDAVTPEVAAAWDEVYWLFGTQLIAAEARLYALAGVDPEEPWRKYEVTERTEETDEVFSLTIKPVEGELPAHTTGQYVAVAVDLPNGERQPRQYTISGAPEGAFRLSIRRVKGVDGHPDGQVSTWLHENAHPGTVLDVSTPSGDVVLEESDAPLVLASAGIGITPMAAIVEDLAERQPQRPVTLLHADRTASAHPLVETMQASSSRLAHVAEHVWYEEMDAAGEARGARVGRMDLTDVEVPTNAKVFMCGPLPFMRAVRRTLMDKGVDPRNISYEVFGPDLWAQDPDNDAAEQKVQLNAAMA
ncbi:hemin transporter [Kytococcus schroeteri]|uniref:nitric oxide dioxygenase n=1 Tax=Kytococcus schroeteri TaxID=138300 RepID=A0A2I1PCP6_9MICO|nr:globin domain-containing protein [Kytococcus schroeteri]PKZ42397.1 hemin transporter [Kytococcus schroeteri]